jgi:DNA-binding transcriptional MerR regulator
VRRSASGDLGGALEQAYTHLALVQAERAQAEAAVQLLERWAGGTPADATARSLRISEAAELLDVTNDMLRNWERNGLIQVPRDPRNGYRSYGPAEIGRLRVIRMLLRAGYSTMAVLRMILHLDRGRSGNLGQVLNTPRPDEDAYSAADQWLSALAEFEDRALDMIAQLEVMIDKRQSGDYGAA